MADNTESIGTIYDFDTSRSDDAIARTIRGLQAIADEQNRILTVTPGQRMADDLSKIPGKQKQVTKEVKETTKAVQDEKKAVDDLAKAEERLKKTQAELNKSADEVQKTFDKLNEELKQNADANDVAAAKNEKHTDTIQKNAKKLGGIGSQLAGIFLQAFALDRLLSFGAELLKIGRQLEVQELKIRSSLLGSKAAAKEYLEIIQQVDQDSPFDNQQIAEGTTKLLNRRILLTKEQIQSLANLAASVGTAGQQSFVQVVEAYLDALVGQYRRLEELGIGVNAQGDKLQLTFAGVTTVVDKTSTALSNYILNLDKANNSQQLANELAETTEGKISAAESAWQRLAKAIGEAGGTGLQNEFLNWLTRGLEAVTARIRMVIDGASRLKQVFQNITGGATDPRTAATEKATDDFIEKQAQKKLQELEAKVGKNAINASVQGREGYLDIFRSEIRKNLRSDEELFKEYRIYVNRADKIFDAIDKQNKVTAPSLIKLVQDAGGISKLTDAQIKQFNATAQRISRGAVSIGNEALPLDFQRVAGELALRNSEIEAKEREAADKAKKRAEKDAKDAARREQQGQAQLQAARERLNAELEKLDLQYSKKRLETLAHNSFEYLEAQRQAQLEELNQQKKHLLDLQNIANGTTFFNAKTGQVEIKPAQATELQSEEARKFFQDREKDINNLFDNKRFDKQMEQFWSKVQKALQDAAKVADALRSDTERQIKAIEDRYTELLRIAGKDTEEYVALIKKRDKEVQAVKFGEISDTSEAAIRKTELQAEFEIIQQFGEAEIDYEHRKNKALLEAKRDFYTAELEQLRAAGADESNERVMQLKGLLASLGVEIKKADKEYANRDRDIYDLLGIKFGENSEEKKAALNEAAQTAIDAINNVLQAEIQAQQERVSQLDTLIAEKDRQIQEEMALAQEGKANSLDQARQEREGLKAERDKALADQRQAQKIQIALNAALQASELTLAIAKTINGASTLGPIVGGIVAAVQTAALIALMVSSVKQISALNNAKYEEGGDVDRFNGWVDGPSHAFGGKQIEVEGGEFVMRRKWAAKYRPLLKAMNEGTLSKSPWLLLDAMPKNQFGDISTGKEAMKAESDRMYFMMLGGKLDEMKADMRVIADHAKNQPLGVDTVFPDGRILRRTRTTTTEIRPKKQ